LLSKRITLYTLNIDEVARETPLIRYQAYIALFKNYIHPASWKMCLPISSPVYNIQYTMRSKSSSIIFIDCIADLEVRNYSSNEHFAKLLLKEGHNS
jgi:hypothetical protein